MENDLSTEEKIKEAARVIFQQKGFAGTRTRDIAEAAGINMALLNYYYRSKEKLFAIVMEESLRELFYQIQFIANDESTGLSEKIDIIVNLYIDILSENPNLPLFILREVQANPELFKQKIGIHQTFLKDTAIVQQIDSHLKQVGLSHVNPFHYIFNVVSMTIFPFVAKPLMKVVTGINDDALKQFVNERRLLIPAWIKTMIQLQ